MSWRRTTRVMAVCGLCAAADGGLPAQAQSNLQAVRDNPVAALSLDQLSVTRERPLFSPSRRSSPPPVAAIIRPPPVQPPPPPPTIELYGTIIDADQATAIIFFSANSQTQRVHIGDDVEGWKVEQIEERKLVLSQEERTAVFSMFADKPADNAPADASASAQNGKPGQPQ